MIIDVLQWNIGTTYDGNWDVVGGGTTIITSGSTIIVKLDDTTGTLSAWKNGSIQLANGPNLFFGFNGSATLATVAPFYQYCEGTTLRQVGTTNSWPYGTLGSNANNSECQIAPTCDLEISSEYTITPASAPGVYDGAFSGSATSSNGLIKYSLDPDFEYGDPFPLNPIDPLSAWTVVNTSSEPMVWTTGATPLLTVTPPTTLSPAKSDWIGTAMSFSVGVTYRYNFQFTVNSPTNQYLLMRVVIGDVFNNIVVQKAFQKSNFVTETTVVITGNFEFVGTAAMTRIAVMMEIPGSALGAITATIDSFEDESGTPADPGVQETLNFTGLPSGTHTIYAKDSVGCQDSVTFEIPITSSYGVKYRMGTFQDFVKESSKDILIDILERSYSGPIIEICGGAGPVKVKYEGDRDDPNAALIASDCEFELLVETDGDFDELFQGDDKKFRTNLYINGDLYHTDYIIPEFHSKPYIFEPYPVTITASDRLGELKNHDFLDDGDNRYKGDMKAIKIIAEILKKTGLELNIRCGINVFDSGMTENPEDDPLDQAYVDSRIYYSAKKIPSKCDVVIKSILDPFRAQLFQSMGVYWIIRLSDAVGTFAYREFDSNGDYVSNSTFNPVLILGSPNTAGPKVMFAQKSQLLTFVRNYGYFEITHNLGKDGNLIDTGLFEEEDIIELASGNKTFKDWNVLVGQGGVRYGHETVVNGDSTGAFYFDFTSSSGNQVDTQLYSVAVPINSSDGRIRFKFQYFVTPKYNMPYIRIAWTLKFRSSVDGTYRWLTYATNGAVTYDLVEQKNDIYVSSFDRWETFDLLADIPGTQPSDQFEISFFLHDHRGRDYASIADFKVFDPSTLSNPNGAKRMVVDEANETNVYTAEYSLDAESLPEVVHPDDYDAGDGNHRWLWRLDKIVAISTNEGLVNRIKFDNVSLAFYPLILVPTTQYIDPPSTLSYSEETDENVSSNFEKPVILGDMIRFDETLERNEDNIYRGYFRLSDGTPTRYWHRSGVDEAKRLLQILLEDYVAQFSLPQKRLSGIKISNTDLHFVNCLEDYLDNTRYRPMTFTYDVKQGFYTPDMSGVAVGSGGEPPIINAAFDNAFSNAFDSTE
jgi:hypothetical protein